MRGKVEIIPDERQVMADYFGREVYYGEDHVVVYQEFSDKYSLGFHFARDDSQQASLEIAQAGHFSYKTENDSSILIFYLPNEITNRQLEFFMQHTYEFNCWKMIGAFSIENTNGEDKILSYHGLDEIKKVVRLKNQFFNQNLEENVSIK